MQPRDQPEARAQDHPQRHRLAMGRHPAQAAGRQTPLGLATLAAPEFSAEEEGEEDLPWTARPLAQAAQAVMAGLLFG